MTIIKNEQVRLLRRTKVHGVGDVKKYSYTYSRLSALIGTEVGTDGRTTIDNEFGNSDVLIKNINNICA